MRVLSRLVLAVLACLPSLATPATPPAAIAFPDDFRNWAHVKSGITDERSPQFARRGGVHHVYANAKALEGLRNGSYPDGAVLVFDIVELKPTGTGSEEGKRRLVDVMVRDESRFAATGGWGYEEFLAPDLKKPVLSEANKSACFNCHVAMKPRDSVISVLRD